MKLKLIIIYSTVLMVFFGCQSIRNSLTFYPDKESEIPEESIPTYAKEIYIRTIDDETIQSFYLQHTDAVAKSLVIYFHGNAGNLYGRFDYAKKLYSMNQNVLLVSYRGYAKSTGKPNENGIYNDGESALKYAIDSLGYSLEDITIIGRSLGTTVAVNTAQKRKLKGVVLITPLTSGRDMATAMGLKLFRFIAGDSFNSLGKINNLISPVLIIHGTKDEIVPYYMGEKLFEKYTGEKKFIRIDNGKHNNLQDFNPKLFWGEINRFLNSQ